MYLVLLGVFCFVSYGRTQTTSGDMHSSRGKCADLYKFDPLKELFTLIDSQIKLDNIVTVREYEIMMTRLGMKRNITAEELTVSLEKIKKGLGVIGSYFVRSLTYDLDMADEIFHLNYATRQDTEYCTFAAFEEDYADWKKWNNG